MSLELNELTAGGGQTRSRWLDYVSEGYMPWPLPLPVSLLPNSEWPLAVFLPATGLQAVEPADHGLKLLKA